MSSEFDKLLAIRVTSESLYVGCAGYFAFLAFLAVLAYVVPGKKHLGTQLKDGSRLTYHLNGFNSLLVVFASWYLLAYQFKLFSPSIAVDNFGGFFAAANIYAFVLSVFLLVKALASGVRFEGFVHNFILGSELNPRAFGLDMKMFALRPAMMGWALLDLSFVAKHMELNGGQLQLPIALAVGFQLFYILDYFYFEVYMTSTWDIVAEHFGLMLVWGDHVFIPFAFTVCNWYLVDSGHQLSSVHLAACVGVFVVGYLIFRLSNYQKHTFKHDPKAPIWGRTPEAVGGKLLASGFWAYARHTNYLGDLTMGFAWCMPAGFGPVWAYFYFIYLLTLLVHREHRDEQRCRAKYGPVWVAYCKKVPYRILPGVY